MQNCLVVSNPIPIGRAVEIEMTALRQTGGGRFTMQQRQILSLR